MLSPYTEPFYLVMEENSHDRDTKEKTNSTKNKKEPKKQLEVTEPKDIETRLEEKIKPELKQIVENIKKQSKEEQKESVTK